MGCLSDELSMSRLSEELLVSRLSEELLMYHLSEELLMSCRDLPRPPGDINTINHPSSSDLVAANGTSIRTYGGQQVNIRLSGQAWTFIIADVSHPLLGADFLSHYSLMVDVARNRLLNIDLFTSTPLCISNIEENINLLSPDGNYADVLEDFDDVFKPELRFSPESSAKHGVQHYIKTTGPPVFSKYRRLRP